MTHLAGRIIDISRPLQNSMPVWPGDTEFRAEQSMRIDRGDVCNTGHVQMSLHAGTHADSPNHFLATGATLDDVDLSAYIGPVRVIDLRGKTQIAADDLASILQARPERLLIRTDTAPIDSFNPDYAFLLPESATALASVQLRLVGLDTPSVDPFSTGEYAAHATLARAGIVILENLDLRNVESGEYELISLPLRFVGLEASPVRAVLRTPVGHR